MNELPYKRYNMIYADPPWYYNKRNNPHSTKFGFGATGHYPVMKTSEICNLPVRRISSDNCALFLWTTMPHIPDALEVLKAWQFRYVTVAFTWVKTNTDGSPWFGVGYYTKSNPELCLLGIKGKMKPISNSVSQVVMARKRKHSAKPQAVRSRIVKLFGDLPRIELFARDHPVSWDVWGNEV